MLSPPTVAAVTMPPDEECQTGLLFTLLHGYLAAPGTPGAPPEPPTLDQEVLAGLQILLSMPHNRALALHALPHALSLISGGPAYTRAEVTQSPVHMCSRSLACIAKTDLD